MKLLKWLCFGIGCVMPLLAQEPWLAYGAGPLAPRTDKDKLQGTWQVVAVEVNGEKLNAKKAAGLKWVIAGDKITWSDGNDFLFKLNPTTKPKQMDLTFPERKTETTAGIYSLDGDQLRVCLGKAKRPTDFTVPAGSRRYLYVLKRERK